MENEILHILQHSLGLNEYGKGRQYRNHFVPGGRDVGLCQQAEQLGFMKAHPATAISGSTWYSVTPAGIDHVALNSLPAPKLTRSQRRYRRFLVHGDMFDSFLSFCRWDGEAGRSWNC